MITFDNIYSFHEYLETQTQLTKNYQLSVGLSRLLDQTTDENLREELSHELHFEDVNIEAVELTLATPEADYLKVRAQAVQNNKYKARYNHMLWRSTRNATFAKAAVDAYIILLGSTVLQADDFLDNQAFAQLYQYAFLLSQEVKHRQQELLRLLLDMLGKGQLNGYQESAALKKIISVKGIPKDVLKEIFDYANSVLDSGAKEFEKEFLQLQVVLAQKIGEDLKAYQNRLGDYYFNKGKDGDGFMAHRYFVDALEQFKKSGNTAKFEEVSVALQKEKANLSFSKTEVEIKDAAISELYNTMEEEVDRLVSALSASEIYDHLCLSPDIFPKADQLDVEIVPAMFELVSVMVFDGNANIDPNAKGGIRPYAIFLNNFSLHILRMFFYKGFKSGKLTFENLHAHLMDNTWYGDIIESKRQAERPVQYRWLDLLAPSLEQFFKQMESDIELNIVNNSAYQLPIDSLAMKFEGLLRAFSERLDAQTIELKDSGTQERISFEKLFENEKFKQTVPADDIAFFTYMFTQKGMNLRNNVAHCFYKPKDYSVAFMWFLIVAVLKLGNYKFQPVTA